MFNIIPKDDLHSVGKYFMYVPFDRESYVALYVRAENKNIFIMRSDDLPVDELEKLYSGKEVSPSYGYSLNEEKLIAFLDSKADCLSDVVDVMAKQQKILNAPETLNLMMELKTLGFTTKVIIKVLTRISCEQFAKLIGTWKSKPSIQLKEKFKKLAGSNT